MSNASLYLRRMSFGRDMTVRPSTWISTQHQPSDILHEVGKEIKMKQVKEAGKTAPNGASEAARV